MKKSDLNSVWENINSVLSVAKGIISSDYGKGLCQKDIISKTIIKTKRLNIPVFIDPKGRECEEYKYSDYIKLN